MIILNVNDLIKFMFDSVANYASVLVLGVIVFFLLTSAVTIVIDKLCSAVCTVVTVYRVDAKLVNEKVKETIDE